MLVRSDPTQWLEKFGDYLYRYAVVRVRDTMLAEDLVQDTLLAAIQAQVRYAGQSSEKTWLTGILKHKIIDHLRREQRESVLADGGDIDAVADNNSELFDAKGHWTIDIRAWADPERAVEQSDFWQIFAKCLRHLPKRHAQALLLRELDGLTTDQICEELSIGTTNNLWVILSRSRMGMRLCLEIHWFNRSSEA